MTTALSYAIGSTEKPIRDLTLGDLLVEAAEHAPDRVALVTGDPDPAARRSWTYAELLHQSQRTALALAARFDKGERVAIWAPNIPEWIMVEFGAAMAGVILVTVNPGFRPEEVQYVLSQSRAAGILVLPDFRGNPMLKSVEMVQPECPELREIIRFDEWDEFLASGDAADVELPKIDPMDPVMIQYTSGTTGFPKGALLHHRGLVNNGSATIERMGIGDGAVQVTTMPLFHTGGCVLCVISGVSEAVTQILVEAFEPGLVLDLISEYGGNALLGVPTMLIAMMEHPNYETSDLSAVKALCSGGSTVPSPLVKQFEEGLGAPFTIVYGQTECSPVATMTSPSDSIEDKADTIGPPMPHVEVKIIDPETGETLPCGQIGELVTRGYHVMHGYFEMPEATTEAIDEHGWLHTGDLAAMDERGYCSIEGRLKDMIIRGGENIYPRELEDLLFAHPSVGEVAIVGLPDDKWGETVGAFVKPAAGETINKTALFEYMREHLAPHKTPKQWFEVAEWPLTGSGKIQKFKLAEQWKKGDWTEL